MCKLPSSLSLPASSFLIDCYSKKLKTQGAKGCSLLRCPGQISSSHLRLGSHLPGSPHLILSIAELPDGPLARERPDLFDFAISAYFYPDMCVGDLLVQ